jgi:hypothetical protein
LLDIFLLLRGAGATPARDYQLVSALIRNFQIAYNTNKLHISYT